jgi:hypothetical protein
MTRLKQPKSQPGKLSNAMLIKLIIEDYNTTYIQQPSRASIYNTIKRHSISWVTLRDHISLRLKSKELKAQARQRLTV